MRKQEVADEAQGLVLDAKYEQFEWAKRALEGARLELGGVIANVGLSAAARRIGRSRQWCLQVVRAAEKPRKNGVGTGGKEGLGQLIDSVRRSGVLEPLIVQLVDDENLRVIDGHRRLRAAIEAGVSNLPINVLFSQSETQVEPVSTAQLVSTQSSQEGEGEQEARPETVEAAKAAARRHRQVHFAYVRSNGEHSERTVDAWAVVFRTGSWYLVGHDLAREAVRTFHLSRIDGALSDVGPGSEPPPGFSAGAHVWGKLDPDSIEMLEEMFRSILREDRSATLSEGAGEVPAAAQGAGVRLPADWTPGLEPTQVQRMLSVFSWLNGNPDPGLASALRHALNASSDEKPEGQPTRASLHSQED